MVILQFNSDMSPCGDVTLAVTCTPYVTTSHHVPGTDGRPSDLPVMSESPLTQHGLDTASSDASHSSHEHTDASSVDSLDVPSAEKPRPKCERRKRSVKDTMIAIYHKRKSVITTTPTTRADELAPPSKSPEAPRRSSAPHERSSSNKLCFPVPTEHSDFPPSKSPIMQKRFLETRKSDGDAISPTADELHVAGRIDERLQPEPQTAPVLLHKPDAWKLIGKMNRKIRTCLRFTSRTSDKQHPIDREDTKIQVVDLSSEDVPVTPSVLALTYSELLQLGMSAPSLCAVITLFRFWLSAC